MVSDSGAGICDMGMGLVGPEWEKHLESVMLWRLWGLEKGVEEDNEDLGFREEYFSLVSEEAVAEEDVGDGDNILLLLKLRASNGVGEGGMVLLLSMEAAFGLTFFFTINR